jgi:hypothetical protein
MLCMNHQLLEIPAYSSVDLRTTWVRGKSQKEVDSAKAIGGRCTIDIRTMFIRPEVQIKSTGLKTPNGLRWASLMHLSKASEQSMIVRQFDHGIELIRASNFDDSAESLP